MKEWKVNLNLYEDGGENAQDEGEVTIIFIEICKFESIVKSKHR